MAPVVNEESTIWLKARRGLKQGDPLSPLLFLLVIDVLDRLLARMGNCNLIEGIGPPQISGQIRCIHYVDDNLLFRGSKGLVSNIKFILHAHELISSLKINFEKSSIISISFSKRKGYDFARMMSVLSRPFR